MGKLVGVLGGLGPAATIDFLAEILENTRAGSDQENVDLIVSQRSSTPDRTAAILGQGEDPTSHMVRDARGLEAFGAEFIVVPCNTASHFMDEVRRAVKIPVADIVQLTVEEVRRRLPAARRIGVMATAGTRQAGVYQRALAAVGLEAIEPGEALQADITRAIYEGVKAGKTVSAEEFYDLVARLRREGAEAVITGCTELSVIYRQLRVTDPAVVDSMDTLARWTVVESGGELRR